MTSSLGTNVCFADNLPDLGEPIAPTHRLLYDGTGVVVLFDNAQCTAKVVPNYGYLFANAQDISALDYGRLFDYRIFCTIYF